jgi:hypothetical protein
VEDWRVKRKPNIGKNPYFLGQQPLRNLLLSIITPLTTSRITTMRYIFTVIFFIGLATCGAAGQSPKDPKGNDLNLHKKSCDVAGVGFDVCVYCEDAALTKNCKTYWCTGDVCSPAPKPLPPGGIGPRRWEHLKLSGQLMLAATDNGRQKYILFRHSSGAALQVAFAGTAADSVLVTKQPGDYAAIVKTVERTLAGHSKEPVPDLIKALRASLSKITSKTFSIRQY